MLTVIKHQLAQVHVLCFIYKTVFSFGELFLSIKSQVEAVFHCLITFQMWTRAGQMRSPSLHMWLPTTIHLPG
jgi:hypothetical protein